MQKFLKIRLFFYEIYLKNSASFINQEKQLGRKKRTLRLKIRPTFAENVDIPLG